MNYVYELRRVLSSHRKGTKDCTGTARANEMQTGEKLISDAGFPCFRCGRFSHATPRLVVVVVVVVRCGNDGRDGSDDGFE